MCETDLKIMDCEWSDDEGGFDDVIAQETRTAHKYTSLKHSPYEKPAADLSINKSSGLITCYMIT